MIYRRSKNFLAGFVGDANDLTEEFYDADDAVNTIDHHNFATGWLTPTYAIKSSTPPANKNDALTVGHSGGNLLAAMISWNAGFLPMEQWQTTLPYTVTTIGPLNLFIYAQGQYNNTAINDYARLDLRVLLNGARVVEESFGLYQDGAKAVKIPWAITASVLVGPGEHVIRLSAFERSDGGAGTMVWEDGSGVNSSQLRVIGYRP